MALIVRAAALVVAGLALAGCSGGSPAAGPGVSLAASPGSSPASPASSPGGARSTSGPRPTPRATGAGGQQKSSTVGKAAALSRKVAVRVVGISRVRLAAQGPGELAGPGAAVRLRVRNASGAAVDLGTLTVNAYYGPRKTPAVPNSTRIARQLSGSLAAGASRVGMYYFGVPSAQFSSLDVEVSGGDSPYVITFEHR